MDIDVGRVGIWSSARLWDGGGAGGAGETTEAAAELGFGALWFGSLAAELGLVATVLSASRRMVVATGVVNVWLSSPPGVAAFAHDMSTAHPGRFLLGVGSSHAPAAASVGRAYERPLAELESYLDGLDAAPPTTRPAPTTSASRRSRPTRSARTASPPCPAPPGAPSPPPSCPRPDPFALWFGRQNGVRKVGWRRGWRGGC